MQTYVLHSGRFLNLLNAKSGCNMRTFVCSTWVGYVCTASWDVLWKYSCSGEVFCGNSSCLHAQSLKNKISTNNLNIQPQKAQVPWLSCSIACQKLFSIHGDKPYCHEEHEGKRFDLEMNKQELTILSTKPKAQESRKKQKSWHVWATISSKTKKIILFMDNKRLFFSLLFICLLMNMLSSSYCQIFDVICVISRVTMRLAWIWDGFEIFSYPKFRSSNNFEL